jgi:hypothetical protein
VCYFGPDTLTWQSLAASHSAWLSWIAADETTEFYHSLRWPGWRDETRAQPLSHGLTVYPFLWSQQAHHDLAATTRSLAWGASRSHPMCSPTSFGAGSQ